MHKVYRHGNKIVQISLILACVSSTVLWPQWRVYLQGFGYTEIISITPDSGSPGTEITIIGHQFGDIQEFFNKVEFAPNFVGNQDIVEADIFSWSDTEIRATVPQVIPGPYDVVVFGANGPVAIPFEVEEVEGIGPIRELVDQPIKSFTKIWAEEFLDRVGGIPLAPLFFAVDTYTIVTCLFPDVTVSKALCVAGLLTTVVGRGFEITAELVADPPREDFDEVFTLTNIRPFKPFDNSPYAQAVAKFKTELAEYGALLEAYLVTFERLQGAVNAAAFTYIEVQAETLKKIINKLENNQKQLRHRIDMMVGTFNKLLDANFAEIADLAQEGLSDEDREEILNAGFTTQEIEQIESILGEISQGTNHSNDISQGFPQWIGSINNVILPSLREIGKKVQAVIKLAHAQ